MLIKFTVFITVCQVVLGAVADSEWVGKRFPDENVIDGIQEDDTTFLAPHDNHGRVEMGIKNKDCDSGEDPKGLDGDLGPINYICFDKRIKFQPDPTVHPVLHVDHIPKKYMPWHYCMNQSIEYNTLVPTYGDHRPLWPRYGEYTFVPKQRWVHSLEHGSIVMLYHPCANGNEVNILKKIIKGCLYQYVITAFNELEAKRPIVLVAWGARLELSKVDPEMVINFIRKFAYKAPEKVTNDGQYDKNLLEPASIKFKGQENSLCPLPSYVI
ncbi:hypothetical protein WA026_023124 [Henosepilachna vigintioctopunctata]|uniref:Uncharacterized protein n=1 Tax=Henosepilachna vigintioctopunctata TaxID=420089 RepID=A0AAW1UD99_9CUCU